MNVLSRAMVAPLTFIEQEDFIDLTASLALERLKGFFLRGRSRWAWLNATRRRQ